MIPFDLNNVQVILSIIGGCILFLSQFGVLFWKLNQIISEIKSRIDKVEKDSEAERAEIRKKLVELELRISDNYLKKNSFYLVTDKIDNHLVRLEAKLDAAIGARRGK